MRLPSCSTPRVANCPGTKLNSPLLRMRNIHRSGATSTRFVICAWGKNLSSAIVITPSSVLGSVQKKQRASSKLDEYRSNSLDTYIDVVACLRDSARSSPTARPNGRPAKQSGVILTGTRLVWEERNSESGGSIF